MPRKPLTGGLGFPATLLSLCAARRHYFSTRTVSGVQGAGSRQFKGPWNKFVPQRIYETFSAAMRISPAIFEISIAFRFCLTDSNLSSVFLSSSIRFFSG